MATAAAGPGLLLPAAVSAAVAVAVCGTGASLASAGAALVAVAALSGGRGAAVLRLAAVAAAVAGSYAWLVYRRCARGSAAPPASAAAAGTSAVAAGPGGENAAAPGGGEEEDEGEGEGAGEGEAAWSEAASSEGGGEAAGLPADPFALVPRWMPDSASKKCLVCSRPFSLTRRRHHCRCCGRLVCHGCSRTRMRLDHSVVYDSPVRVCDDCRSDLDGGGA